MSRSHNIRARFTMSHPAFSAASTMRKRLVSRRWWWWFLRAVHPHLSSYCCCFCFSSNYTHIIIHLTKHHRNDRNTKPNNKFETKTNKHKTNLKIQISFWNNNGITFFSCTTFSHITKQVVHSPTSCNNIDEVFKEKKIGSLCAIRRSVAMVAPVWSKNVKSNRNSFLFSPCGMRLKNMYFHFCSAGAAQMVKHQSLQKTFFCRQKFVLQSEAERWELA